MNTLRMALWCTLLASLVGLVTSLILLVRQTTAVIAVLPAAVERQIREQGKETRTAALAAIGDTRRELLVGSRPDAGRSAHARGPADGRFRASAVGGDGARPGGA